MIPIPTPNFRVEIIIPCDSPDIVSILSDHVEWINGYQYNKLWRRSGRWVSFTRNYHFEYIFQYEDDAILFKLRWG